MDLPKVAILMAIYKPNINWLKQQLVSLNEQTYSNLELIIWNDFPDDKNNYDKLLSKCIKKMDYKVYNAETNLGPTKAFEKLTKITEGREDIKYLAYCDQDDIWLPKKISVLIEHAEKENLDLVCSDVNIIDEKGKILSEYRFEKLPYHKKFFENMKHADVMNNNDAFAFLLNGTFIYGHAMMVKRESAILAIPFSEFEGHDFWLGLYFAATNKRIKYLRKESLVKHRIHDDNFISSKFNTKDDNEWNRKFFANRYKFLLDVKKNMLNVLESEKNKEVLENLIMASWERYIQYSKYNKSFS